LNRRVEKLIISVGHHIYRSRDSVKRTKNLQNDCGKIILS
jgi:hypothetical protein